LRFEPAPPPFEVAEIGTHGYRGAGVRRGGRPLALLRRNEAAARGTRLLLPSLPSAEIVDGYEYHISFTN